MDFKEKINNYYDMKKDIIIKLTNNKINSLNNNLEIIFDGEYYSKNLAIFEDNKKVLIGKYEILGYSNNNKWTWAFENRYIEKYLSEISRNIYKNITFTYDEKDIDYLLKLSLYYSNNIWIIKRNINFNSNMFEYIILTEINQIT